MEWGITLKTCVKCSELNGNNRTDCWKCGATLPAPAASITADGPGALPAAKSQGKPAFWQYLLAFFFPLVGIIMGAIALSRHEKGVGTRLLVFSLIIGAVMTTLVVVFYAALMVWLQSMIG